MNSKLFVILSLCALVFLVSSAIAIEASKEEESNPVNEEKYRGRGGGGRYCSYGCCYYGSYGRCQSCCKDAEEARLMRAKPAKQEESNPLNEEKHRGWGGGGGRGGRGGGGGKCCGKDKRTDAKP